MLSLSHVQSLAVSWLWLQRVVQPDPAEFVVSIRRIVFAARETRHKVLLLETIIGQVSRCFEKFANFEQPSFSTLQ